MSKEFNHYCVVCGQGYDSCDTCKNIKSYTPWRTLTDTIEHYKIFTVLRDFNNKFIDKEEAQRLLSNCDLSEKDSFKDSAKKVLADIYKEDVIEVKVSKKKTSKNVKNDDIREDENTNIEQANDIQSVIIEEIME